MTQPLGGPPPPDSYDPYAPVSPGVPPWEQHRVPVYAMPVLTPALPASGFAVWALVMGVIGFVAGWCLFGVPCLAAIALGHAGLAQTKAGTMSGRGMAVAGLVLGYVMLLPAIIFTVWMLAGTGAGAAG